MHKTEYIRRIANETRLSQRIVGDVVNASQRLIEETLRSGERIVLPGFGTFYTSQRAEGTVRSIQTGEQLSFPARTVAAFRVGEVLKRAVAGTRRRRPRRR